MAAKARRLNRRRRPNPPVRRGVNGVSRSRHAERQVAGGESPRPRRLQQGLNPAYAIRQTAGMSTIKNRIKGHRKVRAGDLVPHELNFRLHPEGQKQALKAIYEEVGFARSLLAYELPDGRLKLIDGHLRRDTDPDMEVEVEVLDVTDEEARKLLLSIDPLAMMAETDREAAAQLAALTDTDSEALAEMWEQLKEKPPKSIRDQAEKELTTQCLVVIDCDDEKQQRLLLERFKKEGLKCRALMS